MYFGESSRGLAARHLVLLLVVLTHYLFLTLPTSAQRTDQVAAIDGEPLTLSQLEDFTAPALEALDRQRHEILEQGLSRLVDERLLEKEASRRGLDVATLLATEEAAAGGPVSESQVDAWYETNKTRLRQPKEALAPQIRQYLEHQRSQQARSRLLESLRQRHEVEIFFEPLRLALDNTTAAVKGASEAPVTITVFSDFECPGCQRINPILDKLLDRYGEDVRLAFRQYPLVSIHPRAYQAAEAALCAGEQGKFWPMHDALFARQRQLEPPQLKERAAELGLDRQAFASCLDGNMHRETVARDLAAGRALGLGSTPSLFVNGRPLDLTQGGSPEDLLSSLIDDELRRLDDDC